MWNTSALLELRSKLADANVLSAYIGPDERDPHEGMSWRTKLERQLDDIERQLHGDTTEFRAARRRVEMLLAPQQGFLRGRGWVLFATASGPIEWLEVPAPMPPLVRWRMGPLLAPCLRAMKQDRPCCS